MDNVFNQWLFKLKIKPGFKILPYHTSYVWNYLYYVLLIFMKSEGKFDLIFVEKKRFIEFFILFL